MEFLRVGPDGLLLLHGVIMSAVVAFLGWRRVSPGRAATVTAIAALLLVVWQFLALREGVYHPVLIMLFVLVPSALLLGASRVSALSRRAWILLLLGPFAFVLCYVGICTCYFRLIGA